MRTTYFGSFASSLGVRNGDAIELGGNFSKAKSAIIEVTRGNAPIGGNCRWKLYDAARGTYHYGCVIRNMNGKYVYTK